MDLGPNYTLQVFVKVHMGRTNKQKQGKVLFSHRFWKWLKFVTNIRMIQIQSIKLPPQVLQDIFGHPVATAVSPSFTT